MVTLFFFSPEYFAAKFQAHDMVGMGSITVTYRQVCENIYFN